MEEFTPVKELNINDAQLLTFMRQRRSNRRYKEKPVPRKTIDRIIDAARCAPTGTARTVTGIIVIDNPEILASFSAIIQKKYELMGKMLKNPIGRFIFKRKAGLKKYVMLREFVMPGMEWYNRWYREGKGDEILRACPALLLFHNPIYEPMGEGNCTVAAFHTIMMAEILKIGTCFNDLIPPMCNKFSELRELIGLPEDREIYASITMGYPKYIFKRVIPRTLAEVRYLN